MKRASADTARRTVLTAVAAAAAAALGAVGARRARRARPAGGRTPSRPEPAPEQTYTCECGAEYRVSGADRHRVYWPAGAPEDDPVLGDRCLQCDRPLAGERAPHPA
jgi:hypothetical protein